MYMYICMYLLVCRRPYIYTHVCICMCVYTCMYVDVYLSVYIYVVDAGRLCSDLRVRGGAVVIYKYTYNCIYVCIYIYHIYIYHMHM